MQSLTKNYSPGLIVILSILGLGILTFVNVVNFDFLSLDDLNHICYNSNIYPPKFDSYKNIWGQPYFGLYIPVAYSTWAILVQGLSTFGLLDSCLSSASYFHAFNLVLHILNSILIFYILQELLSRTQKFVTTSPWPAGFGALFFLLHPLQVEAVAWVSGMRDLLSMTLCLCAFWIHVRSNSSKAYIIAFLFWSLAILTKPSAVVLPGILYVLDVFLLQRSWKKASLKFIPWIITAAFLSFVTFDLQKESVPNINFLGRLEVSLFSLGFYFYKILIPMTLSIDYALPSRALVQDYFTLIISAVVLVASCVLFWILWRRNQIEIICSALWSLIFLVPVLGLVPFNFQNFSQVSDRFMYGSFFGLAFLLSIVLAKAQVRWLAVAFVICLLFAGLSAHRLSDWKNDLTLFGAAVATHPGGQFSHGKYGSALLQEGRMREAEVQLRKAIGINSNDQWASRHLGRLLREEGRRDEVIQFYGSLIATGVATADNLYELAQVLLPDTGQRSYVIQLLKKAADMEKSYIEPRIMLSQIYFEDRDTALGQKYLEEAQKIKGGSAVPMLQQSK